MTINKDTNNDTQNDFVQAVSRVPVVTIDGPSGTGKGTVAHALAEKLGWHYLDSGAVYRVLALAALANEIDDNDDDALVALSQKLTMEFLFTRGHWQVLLSGEDVTDELRVEQVGEMASKISVHQPVRKALLDLQRSFEKPPGLVTDGRDMGTVVFPDALLKVYLEASPEVRARRRFEQLKETGINVNLDKIYGDLIERDRRDRERSISPTKPAPDAVVFDTTELTREQVFKKVLGLVNEAQHKL